jgi:eukaryotic-like serine/threonine-protein kinase
MPIAIGSHLASYEITALLGRGGMGEVFRGRDTKLKRDVAIKVLPEIFSRDQERVNRFVREAEVLASLNHPNIGTIYDFQEAEGIRFLVLELVEGETLAERIQRGPVPADEALQIARQICEALEAAHEKGIIHRDLKPANVKITVQGRVKVLDFGLAKALEAAPTEAGLSDSPTISGLATNAGVILGTAAYMSPEQARAFSADTRSDVFSFGCVVYEMLTGARAFQGETTSDVLASVLKSEPDYSRLPLKLHPRAQEMLRRCLAKDPKRRWQSVADLRIEIETILADPDGLSVEAVRSKPVATPLWKYAMFLVAGAALAAVILSFFLSRPSPTVSPTRFSIELTKEESGGLITGASMLAVSPDGSQVVYSGLQRSYRHLMSEIDMKAMPGTEGLALRSPVFSPDGKSIAFFSYIDGTLKRIPLAGGSPTLIGRIPAPWGIYWYDDWLVFAINAAGSSIMRISERGGQPETLIKLKEGELAYAPQVLPGGKTLLYTVATARSTNRWDNARIVVQSLSAGEPKVVLEGGADARYVSTGHLVYAVGGILRAAPFDLSRLEVTGDSTVFLEGVLRAPANQMGTAHFSFSTNGSLVYLPGPVNAGGSPNVVGIIDRNGKLKTLPLPAGAYTNPRFSTDGKQLAVGTDDGKEANVHIYDLTGEKSLRRLTIEGANRFPLWSPDGEKIVFQSDRGGDRGLWWQRANGIGIAERITKADEKASHVPDSWLPGQKLSFTLETGGTEADLWIVNVEDQKKSPLVQDPRLQVRSVFSHDGHWFAYQTNESGISEIWAQPYPTTGSKYQVLKANVVSAAPLWSKDGKELYFLDLLPGNGRINAVKVTTQNGLAFSNPISLPVDRFIQLPPPGNPRNYDVNLVTGDFVVILESSRDQTGSQAPREIRVVLNSFEELKQRVPTR